MTLFLQHRQLYNVVYIDVKFVNSANSLQPFSGRAFGPFKAGVARGGPDREAPGPEGLHLLRPLTLVVQIVFFFLGGGIVTDKYVFHNGLELSYRHTFVFRGVFCVCCMWQSGEREKDEGRRNMREQVGEEGG